MTNKKLQGRAVRILMEASGADVSAAEDALRAAGHDMRVGLVMLKLGVSARVARKKLRATGGNLRTSLGE
jgi:N-acetylmuramic acid 6-phosphate etherase